MYFLLSVVLPDGRTAIACAHPEQLLQQALAGVLARAGLRQAEYAVVDAGCKGDAVAWDCPCARLSAAHAVSLRRLVRVGDAGAQDVDVPAGRGGDAALRRRMHLAHELLTTEREYARCLRVAVERYMEPVVARRLLPTQDEAAIFGNIAAILRITIAFLADLEERLRDWDAWATCIGPSFLTLAPHVHEYEDYCSNHANAVRVLSRRARRNDAFASFIADQACPVAVAAAQAPARLMRAACRVRPDADSSTRA